QKTIIEDQHFQGITSEDSAFHLADYENCTFINCSFSNANLSDYNFTDCQFEQCDFSLAKVKNTAFRDVQFKSCKLLGVRFEDGNKFGFSTIFENCTLNLSSFYKMNLKTSKFKNCNLQEVDFIEADLTGLFLDNCDLAGVKFERSILEKVDFRTAQYYTINPEKNRIKKAKFSLTGISGLLEQYNIVIE
ncbi:MAG: pentapeptide repeat-containing protein, partial [Arcicella sp.]|nr:pentapeptide repeat-containing protein [Arcicella sp.]